jgi:hypothetical protein
VNLVFISLVIVPLCFLSNLIECSLTFCLCVLHISSLVFNEASYHMSLEPKLKA